MKKVLLNLFLFIICVYNWAQTKQPNIVFILADDMGIGDIEPYGQKNINTPNLNKMAEEGMTFVNFYAGSTVCAPSRASLLTGQHTGHTMVRGNGEFPLDPNKDTFTERLNELGYDIGFFGKWGLGLENSGSTPDKKGIREFAGHLHHMDAHHQRPETIDVWGNGEYKKFRLNGQYANDYFVNRSLSFIKNSTEQPFFLFVSLTIPHAELKSPERFMQKQLKPDGTSKFPDEKAYPDGNWYGPQKYPRAAYASLVNSVDTYAGYILDALREKGIDENTIVIFTSDNGTHVEGGRRMEDVNFFKSSAIYKGVKRDLYTGGIKEPFIVKWAGKIPGNTKNDFTGAFWDLYPTFIDIAGGSTKGENIDGLSIKNTLLGKSQQKHDYLYWEFHKFGGKQAVLKDEWKAIRLNVNKNRYAEIALYNIQDDPEEKNNLADKYPDKAKEMTKLLDSIRTENENFNFKQSIKN